MKKVGVFGILVLLLLGLGTTQAVAENKWSFGKVGGYYFPSYGEVNEYLEEVNDYWGTDLGFSRAPIFGLAVSYDLTPNFRLRGEMAKFKAKTSDIVVDSGGYWDWWYYYSWERTLDFKAELTVTPIILSGTYLFPSAGSMRPYLGAGVGKFITKGKASVKYEYDEYLDSWRIYHEEWSIKDKDIDYPIGVQLFGGLEGELSENISFGMEIRYISAEAELGSKKLGKRKIEVDLGGLMFTFMMMIKV